MPSPYRRSAQLARGCGLAALAAALAPLAWAEPAPAYRILLEAAGQAPAALEASALVDAANARARQAASRANPTLSVDVENVLGDGPYSGGDSAETTVAVSQVLDLWGRRQSLTGAARAEAGAAVLRRDQAGIEAAARLAQTYVRAEAAERRFSLAEEAFSLTLADARAATRLVEEGREPMLRALQAESETADASAGLDEARAERDAAYAALTAAARLPAPVTSIPVSLLDVAAPSRGETPAAPAVRLAEAEREAARARLGVEQAASRPSLTANLGLRRFEAAGASAMTVGVSLPLPLFDRNRGNLDAAQAEVRAADARLTGARQEAAAGLGAAAARLRASASRVRAADAGADAAEEAYRLARIGAEAGRISQLELRVTRAALIRAKASAVDARLARAEAEIDLARLEGRAPFGDAR